jgi:regulator of RNase E activity RraA
MNNTELNNKFQMLSTPLIADACVRLKIPIRIAPSGITPLIPNNKVAGTVLCVTHYGSVDLFFELMEKANNGDIMVIDNGNRTDEACIGDLTVLEAKDAGLSAIIVWGLHRDTNELKRIRFPVFTYGSLPLGPTRSETPENDPFNEIRFGLFKITPNDVVFADDDGVLFVEKSRIEEVIEIAVSIYNVERNQAKQVLSGKSLRNQLKFREYLEKKKEDGTYTLRKHLRSIGGAIEE